MSRQGADLRPRRVQRAGDGGARVAEGARDDVEPSVPGKSWFTRLRTASALKRRPCVMRSSFCSGAAPGTPSASRRGELPGSVEQGEGRRCDRRRDAPASPARDRAPRPRGRPHRARPRRRVGSRPGRAAQRLRRRTGATGAMRAATSVPRPGRRRRTGDHLGQHRHVARVEVLLEDGRAPRRRARPARSAASTAAW